MDSKFHILEGQDKGLSFELKHGSIYTIGRSPENDIQIRDKNVSRYHLKIQRKEGKYFITDLKSRNGTFINGKDIEPGIELELNLGTPIVIGMTMLGLGDVCATCLAPFLESIGICGEIGESGEAPNPHRIMALKKDLELIYNVSNALVESKNIHEILEKTLDHIFNLMKRTDRCAIILADEKTGDVSDVIYRSRKPVDNTDSVYNRELVERALLLNKAVYVSDSYAEDLDEDDKVTESMQLMNIRSAMCVPMCSCLGTRGTIYADSIDRSYGFRISDLALLKDVGSRVALAMYNIELNESMRLNNNN